MRLARWLLVLMLFVIVLAHQGVAQDAPSRTLTWDELKRVQAEERAHVQSAQKEMLDKLIEAQRDEMKLLSSTTPTPSQVQQFAQEQAKERLELAKTHAEERSKLAATHAQERT